MLFSCQVVSNSVTPRTAACWGFPAPHHLLEFAQVHVHWISDTIQPYHPLKALHNPYNLNFYIKHLKSWSLLFFKKYIELLLFKKNLKFIIFNELKIQKYFKVMFIILNPHMLF